MNVRFDDGEKLLVLCEEQGRGVVWAFEDVAARPTVHRSDGMNTALRAEPAEAGAWHADGAFVSNSEQVEVVEEVVEAVSGVLFALLQMQDGRRGWVKEQYVRGGKASSLM